MRILCRVTRQSLLSQGRFEDQPCDGAIIIDGAWIIEIPDLSNFLAVHGLCEFQHDQAGRVWVNIQDE